MRVNLEEEEEEKEEETKKGEEVGKGGGRGGRAGGRGEGHSGGGLKGPPALHRSLKNGSIEETRKHCFINTLSYIFVSTKNEGQIFNVLMQYKNNNETKISSLFFSLTISSL